MALNVNANWADILPGAAVVFPIVARFSTPCNNNLRIAMDGVEVAIGDVNPPRVIAFPPYLPILTVQTRKVGLLLRTLKYISTIVQRPYVQFNGDYELDPENNQVYMVMRPQTEGSLMAFRGHIQRILENEDWNVVGDPPLPGPAVVLAQHYPKVPIMTDAYAGEAIVGVAAALRDPQLFPCHGAVVEIASHYNLIDAAVFRFTPAFSDAQGPHANAGGGGFGGPLIAGDVAL